MAGLTPLFNAKQVQRWADQFTDQAEDKMIQCLIYAGEYFVKLARDRGEYRDVTGNLRSSIGYVVLNDGNVLQDNYEIAGKGSEGEEGVKKAKALAAELALTHNKGLVLVGMAGMEYAVSVENLRGKDVISSSQIIAEEMLKDLLKKTINNG